MSETPSNPAPEPDGSAAQGANDDAGLPAETPVGPGDPQGTQESPDMIGNPDTDVDANPAPLDTPEEPQPGPQDEQLPDEPAAAHAPWDPSGGVADLAPGGHS